MMWIRSQDKEKIVECNYVFIGFRDVYSCIYQYLPNSYTAINLGEYSTKEKALKVLDMIQEHISGQTMAEEFNLPFYNIQEVKEKLNKNRIFQMPKDDEVK